MRKKIFHLLFILSLSHAYAQPVLKSMLKLPDTGATSSYTNTFGEDNDYTFNAPRFKPDSVGTTFVTVDSITGLMWSELDGTEMTYPSAVNFCNSYALGNYTDWRLPTAHEAFSILNHQHTNPALDPAVFQTSAAEYWWTSTHQVNDTNKQWVTNAGGGIGNHPKTETISAGGTKKFFTRCVRDMHTPTTVANHFINNNDGTISDALTGLYWQKVSYSDSLTWEDALQYADTFSLAGYSDWRLPNIKEIHSINDENIINPSINTTFFTNAVIGKYWSSTTLPNFTGKAWYLDTKFGITTYANKTNKLLLYLVRGNGILTNSIAESKAKDVLKIFPNPCSSILTVEGLMKGEAFAIYNLVGDIIISDRYAGSIDLSGFAEGMYMLQTKCQYLRFIKQ
jgi:hypothetical protein